METGEFAFRGNGSVSNYRSENPEIAFHFATSSFPVDKSRTYLPLWILPEEYHHLVHQRFQERQRENRIPEIFRNPEPARKPEPA